MNVLGDIFFVFWFFAPAGVAIALPLYAAKLPFFKQFSYPVDCYATFRGKRIFGSHKTVRGFLVGTLGAIITVYLEIAIYQQSPFIRHLLPLNYTQINPLLLGFLLGFGGLTGDAIKSFFKRQLTIAPGKSWFPFDQTDHIIGGIVFTMWYIPLTLRQDILLALLWFLVHLLTSFVGFLIKLKKEPI